MRPPWIRNLVVSGTGALLCAPTCNLFLLNGVSSDVGYDPNNHSRRSVRLRGYDYAGPGAYFVTLCVHQKEYWLGEVVDGKMVANKAGDIVRHAWEELPQRFPGIGVDVAVVMPNHFHGIIIVGAQFIAPSTDGHGVGSGTGAINRAPTLGKIIRAFKAVATRKIRKSSKNAFSWQRNYYERVIRNEMELHAIRQYIADNPRQWDLDRENPNAL